jgi:putative ABC transport system permease protein
MPIGPILRAMRHNRVRVVLILLEIAFTLAIVANCVNMIVAERRNMMRKSGFDDANLVFVNAQAFSKDYEQTSFVNNLIQSDLRQLHSIPGVKSATNTYFLPWQGGGSSFDVKAAGGSTEYKTQYYPVTPEIFDTLGTRLTEGRGFTAADYNYDPAKGRPNAYVISRALARKAFGNQSPIGKIFTTTDGKRTYPIVGVIDDFYNPYAWGIGESVLFTPRFNGGSSGMTYLVRVEPGAMKSVIPLIEARLLAGNRNRVINKQTINDVKDQFNGNGRLIVVTMTAVILLLVFVTTLGIVGITSLSVAERARQIGTRRALGATRSDIVRHFLLENWLVTTGGLMVGVVAAYALNYALVSQLSNTKLDWRLVAVGMVLLWAAGLLATLPPALRASSVSPAIATRSV